MGRSVKNANYKTKVSLKSRLETPKEFERFETNVNINES